MKRPKFIDALANSLGYVKEVAVSPLSILGLTSAPPKKQLDYLKAYAGWVFACAKARADDVAQIQLKLYKVKDRKTGEVEQVYDHEVLSLLRSVNPWTTARDLFKFTQSYKDLAGESFWYLNKSGKNGTGKITQIIMLRPDWIEVVPDEATFIKHYKYKVPGMNPVIIPADQIIHFKEFNPTDPYRGLSIVGAGALTIDTDNFSEKYNRKFFENSAIPSVVLETEQKLDDRIANRVREQWYNEYGGPSKAHKVALLEGGLKINPFSISHKDAEFLEGQKFNRDKILALFQVPKTVLGMTEGVTVSNADATDRVFSKRVVKPQMQLLVDTLTEFLLPHYRDGDKLFFGFEDPVPENVEQKNLTIKALFEVGAITQNEIREQYDMDVSEDDAMDRFYLPFNLTPVTGGEDDEMEPAVRSMVRKKLPAPPPPTIKEKIKSDISSEVHKEVMGALKGQLEKSEKERRERKEKSEKAESKKKAQKDEAEEIGKNELTEDQKNAVWHEKIAKTDSRELQYRRLLTENFNRQQTEALQRLEESAKNVKKALTANQAKKILFNLKVEDKIIVEMVLPLIQEIIQEAGEDGLALLGLDPADFNVTDNVVQQFIKGPALKGVKKMNRTTKTALRQALAEVIQNGGGIPEASEAIQRVFETADKVRADRIARTEVLKANNKGTVEAWKQSNVVVGKEWFTAIDERVCEWCGPMHGKVIGLNATYVEQGETLIGAEGRPLDLSFAGVDEPPLHPNCRCTLLPVIKRL